MAPDLVDEGPGNMRYNEIQEQEREHISNLANNYELDTVKYVEAINKIPRPKNVHIKVYRTEEYIVYDSQGDITLE